VETPLGGEFRPTCALPAGEDEMARVKRGTKRRARRKKYLKRTKGFFLTKSKLFQSAQEAANRADRFAYRDRRNKKRQFRRLWIQRIGAGARLNGMSYSQLMHGLKAAGVAIDRKILADLAVKDAATFAEFAAQAKQHAPAPVKAKKKA
jgi:large subunit ribosomal protein L20